MGIRKIPYLNTAALAGLSWEKSPRGLKDHALGVRWGSTFAPVSDAALVGTPSFLSLVLSGISDKFKEQTLLVAYANTETSIFFGALTSGAKPVLEPERLFETQDELLSWLAKEMSQDGVQGLVLSAQLDVEINTELPTEQIVEPPSEFAPAVLTGRASKLDVSKTFEKMGNGAMVAVCALLAITVVGGGVLVFGNREQAAVVAAPIMKTVYASRDEGPFLRSCAAAFAKPWNVGPGWTLTAEGCGAPGMDTPIGVPVAGPVAYQILSLRLGYDAAIARAAAELVLGADDAQLLQSAGKLIITRPVELLEVNSAQPLPPTSEAILPILESAYLGKARTVRMVGLNAEITLWGGFTEATEPLASLPWAEVQSLTRRDGLVTLVVGAKRFTPFEIIGEG